MLEAAYGLEPLEDIDEQSMFLSILYHDARGGNAIRMLLGEDKDKPYVRHYASRDHSNIQYRSSKYNAYCTVNTFKSFKRVSEDVWNYSGIFIDLDGHDFKSVRSMDKAIEFTKARLKKAFKDKEVSVPTMITHTGRGLGIFYILKTSIANSPKADKSIKYLDEVRAALMAKYRHILSGKGYLDVDSTVKDSARVCRIPLTYNLKADRWCRLIHVSYDLQGEVRYYDLKEIARESHLFDEINQIKKQIASRKVVSLDAYKLPFLTIRMQKLEILQELRNFDCAGYREYMIFIFYNSAKQVYGDKGGAEAVKQFNRKFRHPLDDQELTHAIDTVDKNIAPTHDYEGYYKIPDSWVIDTLEITEQENRVCRFGSSKRQIERQQRKEANKSRREQRNKEIADYIIANPGESYPDIADKFDVSESTIYRICKQYDITRYNKKEEEGSGEAAPVNLQKVAESLLGVDIEPEQEKQLAIIQAYEMLYDEVKETQRRRKQIPGQIAFRFRESGDVEYYMIS